MAVNGLADAMAWAQHTFGELDLGDPRRTRRLVQVAGAIAADPQASLPRHMAGEWSALKAVYRLLRADGVSHEAIRGAVCQQTRQQMQQGPEDGVLLLVHDDPELDYGYHSALAGLGPIGNGSHRGFFVHSVLAMGPTQDSERILGLVHQEPWVRVPAPRQRDGGKRSSRERGERPRESEAWTRAVEQVGPAPSRQVWIHVGDRYADMFAFLQRCRQMGTFFVVRAAQNRRVLVQEHEAQPHLDHLLDCARSWPAQATGSIEVPSEHERRARVAQVQLSWASMQLLAPENGPEAGSEPLPLWVLRVWEPQPPDKEVAQREYVPSGKHGSKGKPEVESEQVEALEGILLSALPVDNEQQAWQVIASSRSRWPIEDLHRGLKTGCRIEQRHLQEQRSLENLLAVVSPIAVRLLQLRNLCREEPEQPALAYVEPEEAQVVATQLGVAVEHLNLKQFVRCVAQLGGFLGRRSDGDPGWQTLWNGWLRLRCFVAGMHFATSTALDSSARSP